MAIDYKDSISNPIAVDIGNKSIQGTTVSKTIKLGLFTTNANAVWAARNRLQKESFPFAEVSISLNRNMFRLQVGDVFKFSYAKYSIVDMVLRVMNIEEAALDSEEIVVNCVQDFFSATNIISTYTGPVDHATSVTDYTVTPIVYQNIIEAPYLVTGSTIGVIPLVVRPASNILGYTFYMSSDDGASYSSIESFSSFAAYGTLVSAYPADTYQIDDIGITVDFVNDDIGNLESLTRQGMLGVENLAVIGNEIMSIQTLTPDSVVDDRYRLTGIYRGRFDTERETHAAGAGIYIGDGVNLQFSVNEGLLPGTTRKFKVVPYNIQNAGAIADSVVTTLPIVSRSRKPYTPINFSADDVYYDDVVLTWSPRVRGIGAGAFAPVTVDKAVSWEGFFEIEVYVSSVLVRTATAIDDDTWTYTSTMNTNDNGTLADEITFKLINYIEYDAWENGESAQVETTVEVG